ncbi:MAG: cytochrome c3 family protein [Desulfuromonadaceae bacterium]
MLGAAMFLALPVVSMAKIAGECSDCHTMHNSKAGQPMAILSDGSGPSLTPYPVLLLTDCVGCHASGGTSAIADFSGSSIPQVYHTDTVDLAGGNFAYIDGTKGAGADDRKGHNVVDILAADATLTGPPGMGRGATSSSLHTPDVAVPATSFTCAGNDGCHGTRNRLTVLGVTENLLAVPPIAGVDEQKLQGLSAVAGAHHYNVDGQIDGSIAGADATDNNNSYRFLRGLYGTEAADWQNTDAANHNEYYGVSGSPFTGSCEDCHDNSGHGDTLTTTMTTPSHSISGFCSSCHGTFHQDTDAAGSFIRHPTDFALPNKTEYAAYTAYDVTGHIARTSLTGVDPAVVTPGGGSDVVMCLSCHVAHGSNYAGMLRFDYDTMIAGGGEVSGGCFACHTTKDTGVKTW